jgi:hypothetical protein
MRLTNGRGAPLCASLAGCFLMAGARLQDRAPADGTEAGMTAVDATFEVVKWDEQPWDELVGGPKLTRARVAKRFRGPLAADSELEYLMLYRPDGSASFVGLERVTGSLLGRTGTFVLRHEGTFQDGVARADCLVVTGSGTGALAKLAGRGELVAEHGQEYAMTLQVSLE